MDASQGADAVQAVSKPRLKDLTEGLEDLHCRNHIMQWFRRFNARYNGVRASVFRLTAQDKHRLKIAIARLKRAQDVNSACRILEGLGIAKQIWSKIPYQQLSVGYRHEWVPIHPRRRQ